MPRSLTHPVVREIVQDQSGTEGAGGIDAAARVADLKSTAKKTKIRGYFCFFGGISVVPFNSCLLFDIGFGVYRNQISAALHFGWF